MINIHDVNAALSSLIDNDTIEISVHDDGRIDGRFNLQNKTAEIEAHRIADKHETRLIIRVSEKPTGAK